MSSKRSPQKQSLHDKKVRSIASQYRGQGDVHADIGGFPTPRTIGGHRPDVVVYFRNGRVKIVEVETGDTVNTAHAISQRGAFQGYANLNRNISFQLVTV